MNGKVFTYSFDGHTSFQIGTDKVKEGKGIYLNLNHETAKPGNEIGYYITISRGFLHLQNENLSSAGEGENEGIVNYVIPNRFYNQVSTCTYENEKEYGVSWTDDKTYDGTLDDATISVRAVNLVDGGYLGMFHIEIDYDESQNMYQIKEVHSADEVELGYMESGIRNKMIEDAITFMPQELDFLKEEDPNEWKDVVRNTSVLEKVEETYFPELISTEGTAIRPYRVYEIDDKYALTVPISYYGLMTMYFAPRESVILALGTESDFNDLEKMTDEEKDEYILWGYDALDPRDELSLRCPDHFWEKY